MTIVPNKAPATNNSPYNSPNPTSHPLQGSKPKAAALSALFSSTCWMLGPLPAFEAKPAASRSSMRNKCSVGRGARLNLDTENLGESNLMNYAFG